MSGLFPHSLLLQIRLSLYVICIYRSFELFVLIRDTGARRIWEVEQCLCPPGYTGLSCETCAPGYDETSPGVCRRPAQTCPTGYYADPDNGMRYNKNMDPYRGIFESVRYSIQLSIPRLVHLKSRWDTLIFFSFRNHLHTPISVLYMCMHIHCLKQ